MEQKTLYIEDIKSILPHRYPFLLIDRVIEFTAGVSGTAIKNVTANEEFFNGHFPAAATMPGVLILEAMSQTAAVVGAIGQAEGNIILLTSIENAKFKNRVVPGDQLVIKVEKIAENAQALLSEIDRKKPSDAKADFLRSVSINSTMSPGVWVEYTLGEWLYGIEN